MTTSEMIDLEEWITAGEAAAIMTKNSGHYVSPRYVLQLATSEHVATINLNPRYKLYRRSDVEVYRVKQINR